VHLRPEHRAGLDLADLRPVAERGDGDPERDERRHDDLTPAQVERHACYEVLFPPVHITHYALAHYTLAVFGRVIVHIPEETKEIRRVAMMSH
jgi:hypothetical protein